MRASGVSVLVDTVLGLVSLKSTNLIDQSTWCGPQSSIVFTSTNPFSPITYNLGTIGEQSSLIFLDFPLG